VEFILNEAPEVSEVAYDLLVLQSLRRLIRATDIFSRRLVAQHKVSGPQLICLHRLLESDGLTVTQLSQAVYLSPSTVVGILDRLERQELVTRIRSLQDRRKVLIHVTQKGRDLVQDAPSPLQEALQAGLAKLPIDGQQTIADSMAALVAMLEVSELDAAPILETGTTLEGGEGVAP
jgi:DNA-binding MarR family transcriptional regulator